MNFKVSLSILFTSLLGQALAQFDVYNEGTASVMYIGSAFALHADGNVENAASATMQFDAGVASLFEIDGNFTNSGTGILIDGIGTIGFTGGANQDVDFGGDEAYSVTVDNSSGDVDITSAVTVTNNVTFINGDLITTGANLITFGTSATASGASAISHVFGPVKKQTAGTSLFTLPTGDGTAYQPIGVTPDGVGATDWTGEYISSPFADRTVSGAGIDRVSGMEYWNLDHSGVADGEITLNWGSASGVSTANTADMLVGFYDGADWISMGGAGITGNSTAGNVRSGSWTNWTQNKFTLASSSNLNSLPVELISFDAIKDNDQVVVEWATGSEINSDYFNVLRSSDGISFTSIGTHLAAGNSNVVTNYVFYDLNPNRGLNYYKLQEFDFDGAKQMSDVKVVQFSDNGFEEIANVFPNPSFGSTNLLFVAENDGVHKLEITDQIGKVVYSANILSHEGGNTIHLNLYHLSRGIYHFNLIDPNNKVSVLPFMRTMK
jgi:hypothetical protein